MLLRSREGNFVRPHPFMDSRSGSCLVSLITLQWHDSNSGNTSVMNLFPTCLILENKVGERFFWVSMVLIGFTCVSVMLTEAVIDWINFPTRKNYITNIKIQ